jgi:hypothetical protein
VSDTATPRVEIDGVEALARALAHPDAKVRHGVLNAVRERPGEAARLPSDADGDLEAALLDARDRAPSLHERALATAALLSLPGLRAARAAAQVVARERDTRLLLQAAARVAELPAPERAEALVPLLDPDQPPTRRRAAANLLADVDGLAPETILQVALLADHAVEPPLLTPATLPAWRSALSGDLRDRAWELARRNGPEALDLLLEAWSDISAEQRRRLLQWAAEAPTHAAARHVRHVVDQPADEAERVLALDALARILDRTDAAGAATSPNPSDTALLAPLLDHGHDDVGAGAIRAWRGPLPDPPAPSVRLARATSAGVRKALVARFRDAAATGDERALGALAIALRDDDWRVRSRATDALAALGAAGVAALEEAAEDPSADVRMAAARGLHRAEVLEAEDETR